MTYWVGEVWAKRCMNLFSKKHDENELYSLDGQTPADKRSGAFKQLWLELQNKEVAEGSLLQRAATWIEVSFARRIVVSVLMLIVVMVVLGFFLVLSSAMGGGGDESEVIIRPVSLVRLGVGL